VGAAAAAVWFVMLVFAAGACRQGVPVVDTNPPPASVDGTISGTVSTPAASRLSGRRVEAVNVVTGERVGTSTSATGGFSLKVAPGKYRLVVELRNGESLLRSPEAININPSDLDHDVELVVNVALSRPRQSDSLRGPGPDGAPIA
jgi:hypothetical protein